MKNVISHKNKTYIVGVILLTTIFIFIGCGNRNLDTAVNKTISENRAESEGLTYETADASESEGKKLCISAEEYYVDYPLILPDGRQVYIKKVPNLHFYPNGIEVLGMSCLWRYTYENYFITAFALNSEKRISDAEISYKIEKDDSYINSLIEDELWYSVSEPEEWENGITVYEIEMKIMDAKTTSYLLYYRLDDEFSISIDITGFLGDSYLLDNGELIEENEEIFNFYRTEENLFIVVDPKITEVIVSNE